MLLPALRPTSAPSTPPWRTRRAMSGSGRRRECATIAHASARVPGDGGAGGGGQLPRGRAPRPRRHLRHLRRPPWRSPSAARARWRCSTSTASDAAHVAEYARAGEDRGGLPRLAGARGARTPPGLARGRGMSAHRAARGAPGGDAGAADPRPGGAAGAAHRGRRRLAHPGGGLLAGAEARPSRCGCPCCTSAAAIRSRRARASCSTSTGQGRHRPVLPRRRADRRAGEPQPGRHRRVAGAGPCASPAPSARRSCT